MTWKLNGTEVHPVGDAPPTISMSIADLTNPGKVKGVKTSTMKMVATKALRRIIGSRYMAEGPHEARPTITKESGGIQLLKASVIPVSIDEDAAELVGAGENAGWMEWAKATKLDRFDFGLTDDVTAAYQRACWSDEESIVNFPLANYGGLDGRASTYDVPEVWLRPGFRIHRVLTETFKSIGYKVAARGKLTNEWKRYGILYPTDKVRSYDATGGVYSASPTLSGYASTLSGGSSTQDVYTKPYGTAPAMLHFNGVLGQYGVFATYLGRDYQYYGPSVDCKVRVELVDVEITGWATSMEGSRVGFVLWNRNNSIPLGVIWSAPLVSGVGTPGVPTSPIVVNGTYNDAALTAGSKVSVGVWNDINATVARVEIGTKGTSQVVFTAMSVPYQAALPMYVNTIMPSWSVMDLLADLIKSRFLVVSTDDTTKVINVWMADDYFGLVAPVLPWRDWSDRIDTTRSPAKVVEKMPANIAYRTEPDDNDSAVAVTNELSPAPGYGNGDVAVGGYDKDTEVKVKWSPTIMANVFSSATMRVPLMRDKFAAYQANKFDRKPRFLIFDGVRDDGSWKHAGTTITDWPLVYFAMDGRRTLPCGFGNSKPIGDEPKEGTVDAYGRRWHDLMKARRLEASLLIYPHELVGFNFGLPTLVDDGSGPRWYYVDEIKDYKFTGGGSVTKCVLVEVPGANVDLASVTAADTPLAVDPIVVQPPFIPADPCAGRWAPGMDIVDADTMLPSSMEAAVLADPTTYPIGTRILVYDHPPSVGTPSTAWELGTGLVFKRVAPGTGNAGTTAEWDNSLAGVGDIVRVLDQIGTPLEYMEVVYVTVGAGTLYPSTVVATSAFRPVSALTGSSPYTTSIEIPRGVTFGDECDSIVLAFDTCAYVVIQYTTAASVSGGTVWIDSPLMSPVPNNSDGAFTEGWFHGTFSSPPSMFTIEVPPLATYVRAKYVRGGIVQGYSTYTAL